MGYLSLMDFAIYEIMNHMERIYPDHMGSLPKLLALRSRLAALPAIAAYEQSPRAVTEFCPVKYFSQFVEQRLRANQGP